MQFDIVCTAQAKNELVVAMGEFQDQVAESCLEYFTRFRRQTHVTPKSYLSFLGGYKKIYAEKHKQIGVLAERMNTGLEKLIEATQSVNELSKELLVKEKDLAVANVKAEEVLKTVTVQQQGAEKVKAQVQKVKDKAQKIVDEIAANKEIAEGKLEAAR
jgi:dynein heavy chain